MATNTSKVFIDIITQFTGSKSIKQADSAFQKLAKSIGKVVSVAAIEEFSRRSIKAFLADDAAAQQLEKTLTNLGIYFDSGVLSKYIQELQDSTGVLDDELRPAFSSLAVATGSYTKAQDLLNTALDVSQATGKSVASVSSALSRAYLGNYTAIGKLGAGISKAEIKAGNFEAILAKLNTNFGGSAAAAASTYAGKVRILNAAFTDVQETIGKGFVDAFSTLTGPNGSATQFANSMKEAALAVGDLIRGFAILIAKYKEIKDGSGIFGKVIDFLTKDSWASFITGLGRADRKFKESFNFVAPEPAQIGYGKLAADKKALEIAKKTAAEEKKKADAAKKAAKAAADKLKTERANAILNLAGRVLDVEQAEILAALTRDITKEDKDRLLLQQALLNDNADAALKLSQKVISAQLQAVALAAINPVEGWNANIAEVIASLLDLQKELVKVSGVALTASQLLAGDFAAVVADLNDPSWDAAQLETDAALAALDALTGGSVANATPPSMSNPYSWFGGSPAYNPMNSNAFNGTVNVLIDPRDLTTVVTSGQQNETASGIVVGTSRINKIGLGY